MRCAVFLDRDDTLIAANAVPPPPPPAKAGDLIDPALVRLLPGVADGCLRLARAGFALVVISNQGVVARGGGDLAQVEAVNERLRAMLPNPDRPGRSLIDAIYGCPFHPGGTVPRYSREHDWRKPAPGMIRAAIAELDLDLAGSWLIGDADRDLEAGIAAGLSADRCLRIGQGAIPGFAAAADAVLRRAP
jgi:D-glycero-D-manno-heptose 1,7-bisphosphate phosphatase